MKIFGFNTFKEGTTPSDAAPAVEQGNSTDILFQPPGVEEPPNVPLPEPEPSLTPPKESLDAAPVVNDVAATAGEDLFAPLVPIETEAANDEVVPVADTIPEPPRPLVPGAYLNGEYEIKEVVSRGRVNLYLADAGDWGAHDFRLIAERIESPTAHLDPPASNFFPPATRFVQDGREYALWDWVNLKSVEDWNAVPNDETYITVLGALADGLAQLEAAGLLPDLPRDSLFFDPSGDLLYYGFFDRAPADGSPSPMSAVQQLSAISSRFAKTNLAGGATLRLDDEFAALPFSVELKTFAGSLSEGDFSTATEVCAALDRFTALHGTEIALLTDVGMERELNEDCGLLWKSSRAGHARNFEIELLAVADGMGGHEGGEIASDLTLTALEAAVTKRNGLDWHDNAAVLAAMAEVLAEVNDAVVRLTENPPYSAMRHKPGSTLVCALRVGSRLFIGNVGDSRAYRWSENDGLQRLTKDHSYVQDLVDNGTLREEESWGHPDGSIITSHIGMMRGQKRDVFLRYLRTGDKLILVSDGVVDTLRDEQIEALVAPEIEAARLCTVLVNAANNAGGIDNITVAAMLCH